MLKPLDKIVLFPLWLITLLPLRVLFVFSDFLYFLSYHVVGYRKKVVFENLRNSFPEKSEIELNKIARGFYHHLCDYFIESIYLINMSAKSSYRHFKFKNPKVVFDYLEKNRNMVFATLHYGNWDWGAVIPLYWDKEKVAALGIYRPLSNKVFDRLFITLRGKFGAKSISMKNTLRQILLEKREKKNFIAYLVGDQRPGLEDLTYWTTFLNQDTPVITGIEKLAKKFDLVVLYMDIQKVKRGYYEIQLKVISDTPGKEGENEITEKYIREVEKTVSRKPDYWLWSHKRWKFKREKNLSEK